MKLTESRLKTLIEEELERARAVIKLGPNQYYRDETMQFIKRLKEKHPGVDDRMIEKLAMLNKLPGRVGIPRQQSETIAAAMEKYLGAGDRNPDGETIKRGIPSPRGGFTLDNMLRALDAAAKSTYKSPKGPGFPAMPKGTLNEQFTTDDVKLNVGLRADKAGNQYYLIQSKLKNGEFLVSKFVLVKGEPSPDKRDAAETMLKQLTRKKLRQLNSQAEAPQPLDINKIIKMMNAGKKIYFKEAMKFLDSSMRTLDKLKNIPEEQKDNMLKGIFKLIQRSNYVEDGAERSVFKSLLRRLQERNYTLKKILALARSAQEEINKGKKPAAAPQARDISRTIAQLAAPGPANFKVKLLKQLFTNAQKANTVDKLMTALKNSDIPKDELRKLIALTAKAIGAEQKPDTGGITAKDIDKLNQGAAQGGRVNVSATGLMGLGTRSILKKVFPGMGIRAAFKKLIGLPYSHPARVAYRDANSKGNRT